MKVLYLKDSKLYRKGIFGLLSFVNYEYNARHYADHTILPVSQSA